MSLTEIRNVVLLFSNPVWSGSNTVPSTIIRNITALSSQLAYEERLTSNITTLTTTNADTLDGVIQGLLYVPDIDANAACNEQQYDFIPKNVTRRADLPPLNYNLIALAPWFSIPCTQAYLKSARVDPIRAFVFYKPNNSSNKPQDADSPVWNLEDGGSWLTANKYPIFAVSGQEGQKMMDQLSFYSGNIDQIPHGGEINDLYGPNPKDYVRVWTELTLEDDSSMPALWIFVLIIVGALLGIIGLVSCTMHLVQRRRRKSLRCRVESGEVDLEAMGIKRLTVPTSHCKEFPLYTYNAEPDTLSAPPTPGGPGSTTSGTNRRSRNHRRSDQRSIRSTTSLRSKRSSIGGSVDTTATNHQPNCHICLNNFDHRVTIIRELTCGHIFHPECIDEFLTQCSSLCPMCKHSMLPRGYCPRITNEMVRRERALRRLRERVEIEDLSINSSGNKIKRWGKRIFRPSISTTPPPSLPLTTTRTVTIERPTETTGTTQPDVEQQNSTAPNPDPETISSPNNVEGEPQSPAAAKSSVARRLRPRALKLLPTQPEESELITPTPGRKSPSSFARERMRHIAAKNAPVDDPDQQRPLWRRGLSKVFPGYM